MIHAEFKAVNDKKAKRMADAYLQLDPMELIEKWKAILYEDNVRRALTGLDVNEQSMPTTLRERGIGGEWRTITKNGIRRRVLVKVDENPPAGPPLLPYNKSSRLITLAETRHEIRKVGTAVEYAAQLGWPDFTTESGDWVLGYHTQNTPVQVAYTNLVVLGSPLPRRDMTSRVSDKAATLAREALQDWLQEAKRV
jgi:hypothetical protein